MNPRIVLDTNVLVSALIAKGYPSKIINELIFEKKVTLCLSQEVWKEYIDVLNRDRFSKYPAFKENVNIVLVKIEELASKYQPDLKYNVIEDESDNKFLELAVFSESEYLITGNTRDFTFSEFHGVKIVNPKEYWERYWLNNIKESRFKH